MFSWPCVDTVAQPETTQRKVALFTDCPSINISVAQNTFANTSYLTGIERAVQWV
jgi:hypothetical protein